MLESAATGTTWSLWKFHSEKKVTMSKFQTQNSLI